jgi:hypothetical protein
LIPLFKERGQRWKGMVVDAESEYSGFEVDIYMLLAVGASESARASESEAARMPVEKTTRKK